MVQNANQVLGNVGGCDTNFGRRLIPVYNPLVIHHPLRSGVVSVERREECLDLALAGCEREYNFKRFAVLLDAVRHRHDHTIGSWRF